MHRPTQNSRNIVSALVAGGMTQIDVAAALKISKPTLTKNYREELKTGYAIITAGVTGKLIEAAMRGDAWAVCFYLKTKAGWNETQNVKHEHGVIDLGNFSTEELQERYARLVAVAAAATRKPYPARRVIEAEVSE